MDERELATNRLRQMFQSLSVRNYRLYFCGQLLSLTGSWVQIVAQDWLVLELSGNSGRALGTVTALQFAPVIALSLYAGLLADRFDKRWLLFTVQAGFMVAAFGMGALVVTGTVQLWHVYVFALLNGICRALTTQHDILSPRVGGVRSFANAIALNSTVFNTARLVGPAVGGATIGLLGVGPAFLIMGLICGGAQWTVVDSRLRAFAVRAGSACSGAVPGTSELSPSPADADSYARVGRCHGHHKHEPRRDAVVAGESRIFGGSERVWLT